MLRITAAALVVVNSVRVNRVRKNSKEAVSMRDDDPAPQILKLEMTAKGCQCKSLCGATAPNFRCDWCWTEGDCGRKDGMTRQRWDYCDYKGDKQFEARNFSSKTEALWGKIIENSKVGPLLTKAQAVPKVLSKSMITSFDNAGDTLPTHRPKHTHANGVVCKFDMEVNGESPYTGMLASGKHSGLIRLGSARSPYDQTFPGAALKFERSGMHSANMVFLRLGGEGGGTKGGVDFFRDGLSSHMPPPKVLDITGKFKQVSDCRSMVGASDFCKYDADGKRAVNLNFPYEVQLVAPDPEMYAVNRSATCRITELLDKLKSIPPSTKIYDVLAKDGPKAEFVNIGSITTASECVTSLYGDTKLFFRHQRMEEDFKLRPEWIPDIDLPLCDGNTRDSKEWQCGGATGIEP